MSLELRFAAVSDVGRVRKENQDSGYAGPRLLMVADGVGGAARGDVASATAILQMRSLDSLGTAPLTHVDAPVDDETDSIFEPHVVGNSSVTELLTGAIALAHDRISDLVTENPEFDGTSTTVVAALLRDDEIAVAHVGDSRAYLMHEGAIKALTADHSFVQSLVDEGRITAEEARAHPNRNLILRALEGVHEPNPDTSVHRVQAGDRILLCSDGCCGVLSDEEIADLLRDGDPETAAQTLVEASLDGGSTDNVTVVVADVVDANEEVADHIGDAGNTDPIIVGAAAYPLRPPARPSRLRRRPAEPFDPELARYAPRPPRRRWALRLALGFVVLVIVIAGCLYGAYRWSQTEYFVGVDAHGYVTTYRGLPDKVLGFSLHTALWHSNINVDMLGSSDRNALASPQTVSSAEQARKNVSGIFDRNCGPRPAAGAPGAPKACPKTLATLGSP